MSYWRATKRRDKNLVFRRTESESYAHAVSLLCSACTPTHRRPQTNTGARPAADAEVEALEPLLPFTSSQPLAACALVRLCSSVAVAVSLSRDAGFLRLFTFPSFIEQHNHFLTGERCGRYPVYTLCLFRACFIRSFSCSKLNVIQFSTNLFDIQFLSGLSNVFIVD